MKRRHDLPRSMMPAVDASALDEAVRRFPTLLMMARAQGVDEQPVPGFVWRFTMSDVSRDLIVREYHLVIAERDRAATRALR